MKIINIEINLKTGYSPPYAASWKQVNYIHTLMLKRGMDDEFKAHFVKDRNVICNSITKASASKLIDALKEVNTQIRFNRFVTTRLDLPDPIIKKLYEPVPKKKDVKRISIEEQRALEQKYINEL